MNKSIFLTRIILVITRNTKIYLSIAFLIICYNSKAQLINNGILTITEASVVSIKTDFFNSNSGVVLNDGNLHILQNYSNDGFAGYFNGGHVYFDGIQEQLIEGDSVSEFGSVTFSNSSHLVPFHLGSTIKVNNEVIFQNGVVEAESYNGKIVFGDNAFHSSADNYSFVDGEVEKLGNNEFEFPIGDEAFFRPLYSDAVYQNTNLVVKYKFQNSNALYTHDLRQENIQFINDKEYWIVDGEGAENLVLSFSLHEETTPDILFNFDPNLKLDVVRWDENVQKWTALDAVNQALAIDDGTLITFNTCNYGVFTTALIKKRNLESAKLIIYNALSPNDDGINDSFLISGIRNYPDNTVEIYNRSGIRVFHTNSYNETDNMFKGIAEGNFVFRRGVGLPRGTYFYIIKYAQGNEIIQKSGYLYLDRP